MSINPISETNISKKNAATPAATQVPTEVDLNLPMTDRNQKSTTHITAQGLVGCCYRTVQPKSEIFWDKAAVLVQKPSQDKATLLRGIHTEDAVDVNQDRILVKYVCNGRNIVFDLKKADSSINYTATVDGENINEGNIENRSGSSDVAFLKAAIKNLREILKENLKPSVPESTKPSAAEESKPAVKVVGAERATDLESADVINATTTATVPTTASPSSLAVSLNAAYDKLQARRAIDNANDISRLFNQILDKRLNNSWDSVNIQVKSADGTIVDYDRATFDPQKHTALFTLEKTANNDAGVSITTKRTFELKFEISKEENSKITEVLALNVKNFEGEELTRHFSKVSYKLRDKKLETVLNDSLKILGETEKLESKVPVKFENAEKAPVPVVSELVTGSSTSTTDETPVVEKAGSTKAKEVVAFKRLADSETATVVKTDLLDTHPVSEVVVEAHREPVFTVKSLRGELSSSSIVGALIDKFENDTLKLWTRATVKNGLNYIIDIDDTYVGKPNVNRQNYRHEAATLEVDLSRRVKLADTDIVLQKKFNLDFGRTEIDGKEVDAIVVRDLETTIDGKRESFDKLSCFPLEGEKERRAYITILRDVLDRVSRITMPQVESPVAKTLVPLIERAHLTAEEKFVADLKSIVEKNKAKWDDVKLILKPEKQFRLQDGFIELRVKKGEEIQTFNIELKGELMLKAIKYSGASDLSAEGFSSLRKTAFYSQRIRVEVEKGKSFEAFNKKAAEVIEGLLSDPKTYLARSEAAAKTNFSSSHDLTAGQTSRYSALIMVHANRDHEVNVKDKEHNTLSMRLQVPLAARTEETVTQLRRLYAAVQVDGAKLSDMLMELVKVTDPKAKGPKSILDNLIKTGFNLGFAAEKQEIIFNVAKESGSKSNNPKLGEVTFRNGRSQFTLDLHASRVSRPGTEERFSLSAEDLKKMLAVIATDTSGKSAATLCVEFINAANLGTEAFRAAERDIRTKWEKYGDQT